MSASSTFPPLAHEMPTYLSAGFPVCACLRIRDRRLAASLHAGKTSVGALCPTRLNPFILYHFQCATDVYGNESMQLKVSLSGFRKAAQKMKLVSKIIPFDDIEKTFAAGKCTGNEQESFNTHCHNEDKISAVRPESACNVGLVTGRLASSDVEDLGGSLPSTTTRGILLQTLLRVNISFVRLDTCSLKGVLVGRAL
ncbi:hypothetical protein MMC29_004240 [Sticta canariensis]|nr:hypothetical protein [Sticta canariensis]